MRRRVGKLGFGLEVFGDDLLLRLGVQHARAAGVVRRVEAAQQLFEVAVGIAAMPSTLLLMRPLKRSAIPSVCGTRGLVGRGSAPSSAKALAKAGVKQLPLSVSRASARARAILAGASPDVTLSGLKCRTRCRKYAHHVRFLQLLLYGFFEFDLTEHQRQRGIGIYYGHEHR